MSRVLTQQRGVEYGYERQDIFKMINYVHSQGVLSLSQLDDVTGIKTTFKKATENNIRKKTKGVSSTKCLLSYLQYSGESLQYL